MVENSAKGTGAAYDGLDGELDDHANADDEAGGNAGPDDSDDEMIIGWRNSAVDVQAFIDADDPHGSYLEILVTDLEGELGAVEWPLGPMQVRALQRQLDDVRETQAYAEWVADGNAPEEFAATPVAAEPDIYPEDEHLYDESEEGEDEHAPVASRVRQVADPMNVQGLMDKAPLVFGFKLQTVLLVAAVLVGVIAVLLGWLM